MKRLQSIFMKNRKPSNSARSTDIFAIGKEDTFFHEKFRGLRAIVEQKAATPRPMMGTERVVQAYAGLKDGCVEIAIDPARPRLADWVRVVEGKIKVIESYWMLREIGLVETERKRHPRQVIYPI